MTLETSVFKVGKIQQNVPHGIKDCIIGKYHSLLITTKIMSHNSRQSTDPDQRDSRGRLDTHSPTRRQAFNMAKDVNKIPRCQSPDRQYKVPDKDSGKDLRQYEFTNLNGQKIDIRQDEPKTYSNGGAQSAHFNAGPSGSKLNKQHHYYGKK